MGGVLGGALTVEYPRFLGALPNRFGTLKELRLFQ